MKIPREKEISASKLSFDLQGAEPDQIIKAALDNFDFSGIFVGYSGGFDSLVTTHWMMNNVPGCKVFHANTGIGIEATRKHVRDMCVKWQWPLTEIRAKEDCGQDYDKMVLQHGFPGPAHHYKMFQRLKERPVRKLIRDNKTKRSDNVLLATGIRHDESVRRSGYKYTVLDFSGNLLWVNPFYWKTRDWFADYIKQNALEENPVSKILGMSGECLCGAFAHKGELSLIKLVCHETWERIVALERAVRAAGHEWGWEDAKPKVKKCNNKERAMYFCVGCEK